MSREITPEEQAIVTGVVDQYNSDRMSLSLRLILIVKRYLEAQEEKAKQKRMNPYTYVRSNGTDPDFTNFTIYYKSKIFQSVCSARESNIKERVENLNRGYNQALKETYYTDCYTKTLPKINMRDGEPE